MSDVLDQRLNELQRLHRLQRCFDAFLPLLIASIFVAALAIMLMRLISTDSAWIEIPIIVLSVLIPFIAIPKQWSKQLDKKSLAAELDLLCEGRGLCMALAQNDSAHRDPDWLTRLRRNLENLEFPAFNWQKAKFLPAVLVCLFAALLMPRMELDNTLPQRFAPFFDDLISELQSMEENNILEKDIVEKKKKEVEQLKAKAEEIGMNQEIWLARDKIKSYMEQKKHLAGRRLAEAISAAEQLKNKQDVKQQEQMLQSLANLAEQHKDMLKQIKPEQLKQMAALMQQMGKKMQLTPEQQAALREHMRRNGLDQQRMLELARQGQMPQMSREQQERLAQSLLEKLGECSECLQNAGVNMGELLMMMRPNGNITRGPGHVQLTEKDAKDLKVGDTKALPPGARLNADGSITLAESVREADINDAALQEAVRAAAKHFDPTAADARRSVVAPRHRSAIARYFINQKNEPVPQLKPDAQDSAISEPDEDEENNFP